MAPLSLFPMVIAVKFLLTLGATEFRSTRMLDTNADLLRVHIELDFRDGPRGGEP
jgi:hypothetical protein